MEPVDHSTVRRNNLSLVLRLLHNRALSRASLATRTGLNKATVSSLVGELIDRGLVRELGTDDQRRLGRPATLLELDGRRVAALGIELDVDSMKVLATDLGGRTLAQTSRVLDVAGRPQKRILATVISTTQRVYETLQESCTTIAGVTVSIPGLVDSAGRTVMEAPYLHWHDLDLSDLIREGLGRDVPVTVDNDSNLAALAEYRVGEFAGTQNLIYLIGGPGVGAGLIVDGRLARGAGGFAGEVGHMHMVDEGDLCGCGRRGCWETLVGLRPLLYNTVPDIAPELHARHDLSPEEKVAVVISRAEAGDALTLAGLERHARWLGIGLATLVNLFNPEVIILGGFFRGLGPWVLGPADATMRECAIARGAGGCRVVISTLGVSPSALGGVLHAAERVFADPTIVPYATA